MGEKKGTPTPDIRILDGSTQETAEIEHGDPEEVDDETEDSDSDVPEDENDMTGGDEPIGDDESDEYSVPINPADFSADLTNKWFNMPAGKKLVYEGETEDGLERIEVYSMDETRVVMGVETRVIWDRVWLNDELIEDTKDWYAQDNEGNVWYFGEDTAELIDGKIVNHDGAWEAGVDGAIPGILAPAEPLVGESYQTEYYEGVAEDRIDILALDERVNVPYGDMTGCLKTKDYTPLEPGVLEYKYHCPELGFTVLEVALEDGERVELISVEYDSEPSPSEVPEEPEPMIPVVTEEQAKEIALEAVPGEVTDVEVERKSGQIVYVVEVDADSGPETDVIIDMNDGHVIDIET